tara:strand:- start:2259 stop:3830 length:1572 start_codon:yes stop_codon:yes gene_type:complete
LREPAFRKSVRGQQTSQQASLPAPTGGWNARDSIADMSELDALLMENFFPDTTDVRVRKGSANHVTGIGAQVESLMPYNKSDGTQTLFAAAGTAFYNVTTAGSVGAAVVSGTSDARWNHINFTNSGGTSYLCCFSGTDSPQYWDGSTWDEITDSGSPSITGVTTTTLINACVFKRRMFMVATSSLKIWYLPIDSVGGAAKAWDLSGICSEGGFAMACMTWTRDSGSGIDDRIAVITSEGQVVVAEGTDPSSSSTWNVVGVWKVGEPIGRRCMIKYGGEVLIICVDGVLPLSAIVAGGREAEQMALTDKISQAMTTAAMAYSGNYGWQLQFYPIGNQLFLNVPVAEGGNQEQYVMNTITGSWGRFKKLAANCWTVLNQEMYFGGNGKVVKFGATDVFADDSTNIDAELAQAYSDFGTKGRLKKWKAMRPNMLINYTIDILIGMNVDYSDVPLQGPLSITPQVAGLWDGAKWDTGLWGGDVALSNNWQTVTAIGTAGSPRLKVTSQADVRLESSDHLFEFGGVIA